MRTYNAVFLSGTLIIYTTKIRAANKREAMNQARNLTIPTMEQHDSIKVFLIKNKGDR